MYDAENVKGYYIWMHVYVCIMYVYDIKYIYVYMCVFYKTNFLC